MYGHWAKHHAEAGGLGKLPVLKVGRKAIIRRDTLERFMAVNQGGTCSGRVTFAGSSDVSWACSPKIHRLKRTAGVSRTHPKNTSGGSGTVLASNVL